MKQNRFRFFRLLTLILFASCSIINGQEVEIKSVNIKPNFLVGEKYKIEVFESKSQERYSVLNDDVTSTIVHFEIIKDINDLKECSWKYGKVSKIGVDLDENQNKLLNILNGIELKFLVDKNGIIQEILNFEDCKESILKAYRSIPEIENSGVLKNIRSSFESPERFVTFLFPSLTLYFKINGHQFYADSINTSNSFIASPFGGSDIPAVNITKIDSINSNEVVISRTQTIKKEGLRDLIIETFKDLSQRNNIPFDESQVPKKIDISISEVYIYNHLSDILLKVSMKKVIEVDNMKIEQIFKVEIKK